MNKSTTFFVNNKTKCNISLDDVKTYLEDCENLLSHKNNKI